jgi:hypothetical protein
MTVEADAEPNAGFSDDGLLLFVSEEFKHIRMLAVVMDAVIADVHFPKDVLLCHALKVSVGALAERTDKGEHIGVRYAYIRAAAPFGKTEEIALYNRVFYIRVLDQAVVEKGYVGAAWQGDLRYVQMRGDFDAAENADSILVLFLDKMDMVVISMHRGGTVRIRNRITRCAKGGLRPEAHAVIMIANPKKLNAARNRGFRDFLGTVFSAK